MNDQREFVLFITVFVVPRIVLCTEKTINAYFLSEVAYIVHNSAS